MRSLVSSRQTTSFLVVLMAGLLFGLGLLPGLGRCQGEAMSERALSYRIKAEIDTTTWILKGQEQVTFVNTTDEPIGDLLFHLYPNCYASPQQALGRLTLKDRRRTAEDVSRLGYMRIESVNHTGGAALTEKPKISGMEMTIPLDEPLQVGQEIALTIDFAVKFPHRRWATSGFEGGHLHAAHWYPRLAMLENTGWVTASPLYGNEFFGPFCTFDVEVTVPAEFNVEGTGLLMEVAIDPRNGLKTARFYAEDVHDFTWVADNQAIISPPSTYGKVKVIQMTQPYSESRANLINQALKKGLGLYEQWYGPYPYERLVVAWSPHGTKYTREHPGLINATLDFPLHLKWLYLNTVEPAREVLDQLSHQYFYGILANNEAESPWLDEGLSSYSTALVLEELYGSGETLPFLQRLEKTILFRILNEGFGCYRPKRQGALAFLSRSANLTALIGYDHSPFHGRERSSLLGFGLPELDIAGFNNSRNLWMKEQYVPVADNAPVVAATNEIFPESYLPTSCAKAAMCLETLENYVGRPTMHEALKEYAGLFRFKHPGSEDLLAILKTKAGPNHHEMIDLLFRSNGTVDYAVDLASCQEIDNSVGYELQTQPGDAVVLRDRTPTGEEAKAREEGFEKITFEGYEWQAVVRNHGTLALPVTVEVLFEGGRTVRQEFDGKRSFLRLSGRSLERLVAVTVDPDQKVSLDLNRINNSRSVDYQKNGVLFLSGALQFWMQNYLNGWAFFN